MHAAQCGHALNGCYGQHCSRPVLCSYLSGLASAAGRGLAYIHILDILDILVRPHHRTRAAALVKAGVDIIVIDSSQGQC